MNCVPPQENVEVLTACTCGGDLIGYKFFADDEVKTRPLGLALTNMADVLMKRGSLDIETDTYRGKMSAET